MYGLVNQALEEVIRERGGDAAWEEVRRRAAIEPVVFISNRGYPDDLTYAIVGAASAVLAVPAAELLIAFGEHWVLHTATRHYGSLLDAVGRDLRDFLRNLPNLHVRVSLVYPELIPPRFRVIEEGPRFLRLAYSSHRAGLAPFVVGLLQGLVKRFDEPVRIEQVAEREPGVAEDVFVLHWSEGPHDPG